MPVTFLVPVRRGKKRIEKKKKEIVGSAHALYQGEVIASIAKRQPCIHLSS